MEGIKGVGVPGMALTAPRFSGTLSGALDERRGAGGVGVT